ncbi:Amidohydrolase 3 [Beutenbergia cavernae DSM 12333]|uniref:Amidohydrolase 3 n=1 Tax=Beutenbergia cavernae (strain ATCC BAA-8 / DSM 12333 / CCUG 43141 / JCM 11478 / NBRC 16432 / NCIMB 13614 / HKI 0122) TaxID=471853 RepID=C5C3J5_BEUC1|nr:amidohydrolase family protein [Beutenbergia cavernae]ACQ81904.1 Amidohydrolase 3 [Beutenbergia cavernae DSM 12333]
MSTVLRNARLVDAGGAAHGSLVDVVLDGGSVVAVASARGAGAGPSRGGSVAAGATNIPRAGGGTRADAPGDVDVDVEGRWVAPGLWDAHTHLVQWALVRARLDVSAAASAAGAADLVRERLRSAPPPAGTVLVGYGFRDALWSDAPRQDVLDAAAGDVPVVLVSGDLHCGWFSSAALRRFGAPATPDGVLREEPFLRIQNDLDASTDATRDAGVLDALREAATRGVVGVVDLEIADALDAWPRRAPAGSPAVRVRAGVWPQHLERVLDAGLRTGDPIPGAASGVTQGPLKVIVDGSLNTRTAYCHEPYPPGATGRGVLSVPPDELESLMARAHAGGLACAIHAIGDAANTLALDAFARTGARGSVEHAQLLTWDDVARFAELGVVASVQPEHALDDRDVADAVWAGWTDRAYPFAALHAAGVRLALGSDAPVAPLDPWVAMAAAVHRSRDARPEWHPEQHLDPAVAFAASTDGVPRLAPGGPGDVVLLDDDPLAASPAALRAFAVAATMRAGAWTHVGADLAGLLPDAAPTATGPA